MGGGVLADSPPGGYAAAVRAVDRGLAAVGGGAFYASPLPHVSVAWAPGPEGGKDAEDGAPATAAAEAAAAAAATVADGAPPAATPVMWAVRSVVAVIGRRPHVLPLRAG